MPLLELENWRVQQYEIMSVACPADTGAFDIWGIGQAFAADQVQFVYLSYQFMLTPTGCRVASIVHVTSKRDIWGPEATVLYMIGPVADKLEAGVK